VSGTCEIIVKFYSITQAESSDEILCNTFFKFSEGFHLCASVMTKFFPDRVCVFCLTWSVTLSVDAHEEKFNVRVCACSMFRKIYVEGNDTFVHSHATLFFYNTMHVCLV